MKKGCRVNFIGCPPTIVGEVVTLDNGDGFTSVRMLKGDTTWKAGKTKRVLTLGLRLLTERTI